MKKNLLLSIVIILTIFMTFLIFNLKDNKSKSAIPKVRIGEVTHSVFYAPLYVAIENGYFKDNGLNVSLTLVSGADKVSAAVLSGDVQIGFAGAESAIYIYKNGEKDYLQIFSGLTKRDGQFILSRSKEDNFSLNDLIGKEVLVGRKGGMPALNFLNALKKAGINEEDININYSIDFAALSGAFIGNIGHYVNLFEPNATKLEQEGFGYVATSIGLLSGDMPYTTFYAKKSYIEKNDDIIRSFVKAINEGLKFVEEKDSKIVAKTILPQFPDTSLNDLTKIIERYKTNDAWLSNSIVSEKLLQNLEDVMIDNDLLDKYVPYKDLVRNYE